MKKITDITPRKYVYFSYYCAGVISAKVTGYAVFNFTERKPLRHEQFAPEKDIEFKTRDAAFKYLTDHFKNMSPEQLEASREDVWFIRPVSWETYTKQKLPRWSTIKNKKPELFDIEDLTEICS